jgi:hypothetical protein
MAIPTTRSRSSGLDYSIIFAFRRLAVQDTPDSPRGEHLAQLKADQQKQQGIDRH